jgi:hypothetical protein
VKLVPKHTPLPAIRVQRAVPRPNKVSLGEIENACVAFLLFLGACALMTFGVALLFFP